MPSPNRLSHARSQTSPVRRVPLTAPLTSALAGPLFGPVSHRYGEKNVLRGDGQTERSKTFILVEAARRPDIEVVFQGFETPYLPLYQGAAADEYALHAPYLAQVDAGSRAADWLIEESWGQGWGVWLRSARSLAELRKHFRKFTQLYNPTEDCWFLFRFYAPETVRRIIPALPPRDFTAFTQDIEAFITPDPSGTTALVI